MSLLLIVGVIVLFSALFYEHTKDKSLTALFCAAIVVMSLFTHYFDQSETTEQLKIRETWGYAKGLSDTYNVFVDAYDKEGINDEIYGNITVENAELDDMILIKSDGYPTYNFANVVDDHLMGITHVVRGNEYLSSTPKYNRLYDAFGWEKPVYIHCPLITDEEHHKLSKRKGHSSFEDLIEQGFLPETIVNFVALLGWSPGGEQEIFSLKELEEIFDYKHMSKTPAVFDMNKIKWMNGEYIKAMDFDRFKELAMPYVTETIHREMDFDKILSMVKTRIELFTEIPGHIDFFEAVPEYDVEMYKHKKMKTTPETSLTVLKEIYPVIEAQEDFTNDALYEMLVSFAKGHEYKNGYVMWPVRTAVSGKQMTPGGATELMELLGKEESLKRINDAIAKLEAALA